MRPLCFGSLCLLLTSLPLAGTRFVARAQTATAAQQPVPPPPSAVLQAGRREVVLSLVVLDHNNQPVHHLRDADITVTEDGKPQKIVVLQEHVPAPPPLQNHAEPGPSPADAPAASTTPLTILLLDALNTPVADQMFVRRQILAYLHDTQPRGEVAMYGLGARLYPIQEPTRDRQVLERAINRSSTSSSPILDTPAADAAERNAFTRLGADAGSPNGLSPDGASSLTAFLAESAANRLGSRVLMTLSALQILSRIYAPLPGRKNVIWFSGAFPSQILPNPSSATDPQRSFEEPIRKTDALLSAAQIALYPVAAEGLATDAIYGADRAPIGVGTAQQVQTQLNADLSQGALARNAAHATMDEIADSTGGVAFYNTNGLRDAIQRVQDHGDTYYTLIYVSSRAKAPGTYRKIHIKLADGSDRLAYRRGYLERPPSTP